MSMQASSSCPAHMQMAMGITAFFCIAIGIYPEPLYALLPYEVEFHPYTTSHVVGQLQLLFFGILAFTTGRRLRLVAINDQLKFQLLEGHPPTINFNC